MSFFRDCKEKPLESKGRIYYDGLKQRIDSLKKYVLDKNEQPINLSYNLYKTLLRLKQVHAVFLNHKISEPQYFLTDVNEYDIRDAINDKLLTLQEVTDDIHLLESYLIQIMPKALNHLQILPIVQETEFAKSTNDEYLTDLYATTLNYPVLENCETYILILTDSKEKSELLSTIQRLKNVVMNDAKNSTEDVELTDDDTSGDEDERMDNYDWLEDEDLKTKTLDKKEFKLNDSIASINNSSINFDDSLRWSQFPFEKSSIIHEPSEDKKFLNPSSQPVVISHPYTIWYKMGILLSTTILSALGGLVVSLFFTGGFAFPVAVSVGAVMGLILGLKVINSKESDSALTSSLKPLEVSHSI